MRILSSDESFRLLVESVEDYAILMLDPSGNIATWNPGAERIKGYAAEEIIGRHFSTFYREEDVARGWPEEELRIAASEGRLEDEGWRVRKDGSRFWANVVITALRDDDGELVGFAKVTRDLTERKRNELEREAALERERQARMQAEELTEELRNQAAQLDEQSIEMETQIEELQHQAAQLEENEVELEMANDDLQRRNTELLAAEAHYHRLVEKLPSGVFALDAQGRFTELNAAGANILGRAAAELMGEHFAQLVVPGDLERTSDAFVRLISGRESVVDLDLQIVRPSGETRLVNVIASGMREGDRILGAHGVARDITDERRMQESLQESETSYRNLFDSLSELVFIQDLKGRFVNVNEAVVLRCGYSREELVGRTPQFLADETRTDMARFHERFWAACTGEPQRFEMWARTKHGEAFPGEVALTRGRHFGQDVIISVARDITERKRAEVVAERSRDFYMSIFDTFPALIWRADADGACDYFNDAWLAFTGRPLEQELGRGWTEGVHPDDEERRQRTGGEALAAREPFEMEYRLRHHSGEYRWIRDLGRPVYNLEGEFLGYIGGAFDIDAHRRTEVQLRQAQKMEAVGRLAGGIAHDFNNVLLVIKGNAQLALMDLSPDDPLNEELEEIAAAADRAVKLTSQLLSFSRQQVLQPRVLDLNSIIRDVETMLRRTLGEDIELVSILDPELGQVSADPGQIEQILMNLAVNARDAMPGGGKLLTETLNFKVTDQFAGSHAYDVRPGSYVMLSVSDTGVGMSRAVREKVFEPFFTTKPQGQGTGLGLSTVYGIVKQSDGYVWVYSEEGHGTTFTVLLPRVDAPVQPSVQPSAGVSAAKPATILLVEDEDTVRSTARRMLERLGHTVLEAENGVDALRVFEANEGRIDLLLTDIVMPVMGGGELAERIADRWPAVRVLYTSGYTDEAVLRNGVKEGSAAFLQKPYDQNALAEKIATVLDDSEAREGAISE